MSRAFGLASWALALALLQISSSVSLAQTPPAATGEAQTTAAPAPAPSSTPNVTQAAPTAPTQTSTGTVAPTPPPPTTTTGTTPPTTPPAPTTAASTTPPVAPVAAGNDTITVVTRLVADVMTSTQFGSLKRNGEARRSAPAVAEISRLQYAGGESNQVLTSFTRQMYLGMSERRPIINVVPPQGGATVFTGVSAQSLRTRAAGERDISTLFAWAQFTADANGQPPEVLVCTDGHNPLLVLQVANVLFTTLGPPALSWWEQRTANAMRTEFAIAAQPYRVRVFVPEGTAVDARNTADVSRIEFVYWQGPFDCQSGRT